MYLEEFVDFAELEVERSAERESSWIDAWEQEDRERLRWDVLVGTQLLAMKRRLGGDATPDELRDDKKIARRVVHRQAMLLGLWGGEVGAEPAGEEDQADVRREAAQRDWPIWLRERVEIVRERRRHAATIARAEGARSWGNRACYRYGDELKLYESTIRIYGL